ncbi:MAG: Do family serine endopeptidase [Opitutaceae bacterium]|jgi:serine protease Do|nr:Do family serine endopeptidase [Opitutaceae bacterium]
MTAMTQNTATSRHSRNGRRRFAAFVGGGLLAAGALAFSVVALAAGDAKPPVSINVDEKPLARTASDSYAPVIKQVAPSVVKVLVTERAKNIPAQDNPFFNDPRFREFFGPFGFGGPGGLFGGGRQTQRQPEQNGLGSGVVVSADGYIVTNSHVVSGADVIKVSFNDGRELAAKLVGADPKSDLAVIKVDAAGLPAITFADSDQLEVGDRVLAIGNPFGIGQTVTSGMVSGLGRATLGLDYEDFIQTDAAINPGNSGGALVDVLGRLVGVNTAILSRSGGFQGIGFAIPGNMTRSIMEQLVANGKVTRGHIGVMVQNITPAFAEQFGLDKTEGALVSEIVSDGPADKAGVKTGDVIVEFNKKPIKDGRALKLTVANVAPGQTVPVVVSRDGKTETIELKVGELPREPGDRDGPAVAESARNEGTLQGVAVNDLSGRARREFDIPARVRGALVTEVAPDSAAAAAGLQPGDVIMEINRQPVHSSEDAVRLTENPKSRKTLLLIWNQKGTRFVAVDETGEK